ncbi:MAG TPA: hypothetical protein VEL73_07575, partial [Mycobacteriales bacterium]|nr:hypothetical protein [Mycobacteriales bacterium]
VRTGAGRVADTRPLPVLPPLEPLFGTSGLRRGSTVAVRGSASLLLALLAGPSREGAWCAVVGLPSLGLVAAGEAGLALDRLALVPDLGRDWASVAAALLDAVDVVVVAPHGRVLDGEVLRLAARARQRGAVLVPYGPVAWPGVDLRLSVTSGKWEGLGEGCGHLRARRAVVRGEGRGAAARPREVRLWLPASGGGVEPDLEPVTPPLRAVPSGPVSTTGVPPPPAPGRRPPLRVVPGTPPHDPPSPPAASRPAALGLSGHTHPGTTPARPVAAASRHGSAPRPPVQAPPVATAPDPAASRPSGSPQRGADSPRALLPQQPSRPDPATRFSRMPQGPARRLGPAPGSRPAARPVPAGQPTAGARQPTRSPPPAPESPLAAAAGWGAAGRGRPEIPAEVLARLRPASSLPRPPRPPGPPGPPEPRPPGPPGPPQPCAVAAGGPECPPATGAAVAEGRG